MERRVVASRDLNPLAHVVEKLAILTEMNTIILYILEDTMRSTELKNVLKIVRTIVAREIFPSSRA